MKINKSKTAVATIAVGFCLLLLMIIIDLFPSGAIGADIGSGVIFLFAAFLIITGTVMFGLSQKGWKRTVPIATIIVLVALWCVNWVILEDESNQIYCKEKIQKNEPINEGDEFCDKYR